MLSISSNCQSNSTQYKIQLVSDEMLGTPSGLFYMPKDWVVEAITLYEWQGAAPNAYTVITAVSHDQHSFFYTLQNESFTYMEGMGFEDLMRPFEGPANYLIQKIREQAGPEAQITDQFEKEVPIEHASFQNGSRMFISRVKFSVNGINCVMGTQIILTPHHAGYFWAAYPYVIGSTKLSTNAMKEIQDVYFKTYTENPFWTQKFQMLLSNGQITNDIEFRKRQNIIRQHSDDMRNIISSTYANSSQTRDQLSSAYSDMMLGQERVQDQQGNQYRVDSGFQHYYISGNEILGTDNHMFKEGFDVHSGEFWEKLQKMQ